MKKHFADTKIVDIAYSNSEQRLGCCNSDHTLSFWDLQDNFKFEKSFKIQEKLKIEQIYYIEFANQWLTVGQDANIQLWDIQEESSRWFP